MFMQLNRISNIQHLDLSSVRRDYNISNLLLYLKSWQFFGIYQML